MELFYYKGKNSYGEEIRGIFQAESKFIVARMIKDQGFFPVKIKKANTNSVFSFIIFLLNRVSANDLAIFCRQLKVMTDSGVNILESLTIIEKQTVNPKLKKATLGLIQNIKRGFTLAEACKNHPFTYPELLSCMIEAGEISGRLSDVLRELTAYYEGIAKQREKTKNALVYPSILGLTSFLTISFLITNVLPIYANIFSSAGVALPAATKVLISIGSNILTFLAGIIVLIIFSATILTKYATSGKGAYSIDKLKLSIPVIGEFKKKALSARISRVLSILISSGIPLLKAIEITIGTIKNQVFKKELKETLMDLKLGKSLSETMSKTIFPSMMLKMIATGEEAGSLEDTLDTIACFYESEVEMFQERLLTYIEPVFIIVMTVIIAFIMISTVLPMFEIYNFY